MNFLLEQLKGAACFQCSRYTNIKCRNAQSLLESAALGQVLPPQPQEIVESMSLNAMLENSRVM